MLATFRLDSSGREKRSSLSARAKIWLDSAAAELEFQRVFVLRDLLCTAPRPAFSIVISTHGGSAAGERLGIDQRGMSRPRAAAEKRRRGRKSAQQRLSRPARTDRFKRAPPAPETARAWRGRWRWPERRWRPRMPAARQTKQGRHHLLHLGFFRAPIADHAHFDLERRIFRQFDRRFRDRQQRHAAHVRELQRALGVDGEEDFFHGRRIRRYSAIRRPQTSRDIEQAAFQRVPRGRANAARGNHASARGHRCR